MLHRRKEKDLKGTHSASINCADISKLVSPWIRPVEHRNTLRHLFQELP
jgi:hypothetical protein